MASRGVAGLWIAIALLFVAAGVFAALYFQRETMIQTLKRDLNKASIEQLGRAKYNNQNVMDLSSDVTKLESEVRDLKTKLVASKNQTVEKEALLKREETLVTEAQAKLERVRADLANKDSQLKEFEASLVKIRNRQDQEKQEQIARLKELCAKTQVRGEKLSEDVKRLEEKQQVIRAAYVQRIMELQRVNSGLQQVIDKWQKEIGRQEAMLTEQYDGKIVEVNVDTKFIVVDLGRIHHVRPGMRFDVIRWRLNNWDVMGAVEITKVDATTSIGVILDAAVDKKVCPITGYEAKSPEERYSPFATTGANRNQAVELIKLDKEERKSMDRLDPILTGDLITNPFYSKNRKLRFVVAGEPVRDKLSINEIREMIVQYGGEVQDAVDVDTDYVVLGRIPDETAIADSEEAKLERKRTIQVRDTAVQYGIPIMREVELFNFIRN